MLPVADVDRGGEMILTTETVLAETWTLIAAARSAVMLVSFAEIGKVRVIR